MDIREAKQVLSHIADLQDSKRTLKEQMPDLVNSVTPALWGSTLYKADSLQGKVITWIRGYETKRSKMKTIQGIFWKAVTTLPADTECTLNSSRRIELYSLLRKSNIEDVQHDSSHPYQKELEKEVGSEAAKEYKKMKETSLLNPLRKTEPAKKYDLNTAREILGFEPRTDRYNSHFKEFLIAGRATSHDYPQKLDECIQRVTDAKKLDKRFEDEMHAPGKDKNNVRIEQSMLLERNTAALKPGESFMIVGSYGRKVKSIKDLFNLLKSLPPELTTNLPETYKKLLENTQSFDPEAAIFAELQKFLSSTKSSIPNVDAASLKYLFSDKSRDLPPDIKAKLPKLLGEAIQQRLARGLLGNIIDVGEMMPSPEVREVLGFIFQVIHERNTTHPGLTVVLNFISSTLGTSDALPILKWVHENLGDFFEATKKDTAAEKLEQLITAKVKEPLHNVMQPVITGIEELLGRIQYLIPNFILSATQLDRAFANGQVWIEVKKQENGKYTLLVHADEYASQHLSQKQEGYVYWPLTISDIEDYELDSEFFYTFLKHHFEPELSKEFTSTPEALLQVIKTVGGRTQKTSARSTGSIGRTESEMLDTIISDEEDIQLIRFNMQLDALVNLCHSSMKDGELNFEGNEALKNLVRKSASAIQTKLDQIPSIKKEKREAINAMVQEIHYSAFVPAFVERANEDATLLAQPIAEILRQCGITRSNFSNYGTILHSFLGDDLMELVDLALDSVDALPPAQTSDISLLPAITKFADAENISTIRALIRSYYFQMVFTTFKYAYAAYRSITSPIYIAYLLMPVAQKVLPEQVFRYPMEAMSLVQSSIARVFTLAILRLLFDSEASQAIGEARTELGKWVKGKLSAPLVSAQVTSLPDTLADTTFTLPKDAALFPIGKPGDKKSVESYQVKNLTVPTITPSNVLQVLKVWNVQLFDRQHFDLNSVRINPDVFPDEDQFLISELHFRGNVHLTKKLDREYYRTLVLLKHKSIRVAIADSILSCLRIPHGPLSEETINWEIGKGLISTPTHYINMYEGWVTPKKVSTSCLFSLVEKIHSLPLPTEPETFWDKVEDLPACIELLADLGDELVNVEQEQDKIDIQFKPKMILASYRLLAIMERLVRYDPKNRLEGFNVQAPLLLKWKEHRSSYLRDPDDVEIFEALTQYYANSSEDVTRDALFHFAFHTGRVRKNRVSPADVRYYLELYHSDEPFFRSNISLILRDQQQFRRECFSTTDPEGKYELDDDGARVKKNRDQGIYWADCDIMHQEIIEVMHAMVHSFDDTQTVLPRGFRLLRRQAEHCHNYLMVNEPAHKGPIKMDWTDHSLFTTFRTNVIYEWNAKESTGKFTLFGMPHTGIEFVDQTILGFLPWEDDGKTKVIGSSRSMVLEGPRKDCFEEVNGTTITNVVDQVRGTGQPRKLGKFTGLRNLEMPTQYPKILSDFESTQSGLLAGTYQESYEQIDMYSRLFRADPKNTGKIIFCEHSDEIPRMIGHFSEDLSKLKLDGDGQNECAVIEAVMFEGANLKNLLQASPRFARVIASFINEILKKITNPKLLNQYIALAIDLKNYCERYAPEYCDTFLNIESYLEKNVHNIFKKAQFTLQFAGPSSGDLTEADIEYFAGIACIGRFGKFHHNFLKVYQSWLPVIKIRLKDKEFAAGVLTKLFAHFAIVAPKDLKEHIKCDEDLIVEVPSIGFSVNFINGEINYVSTNASAEFPHLKGVLKDTNYRISLNDDAQELERIDSKHTLVALNSDRIIGTSFHEFLKSLGCEVHAQSCIWFEKTDSSSKIVRVRNDGVTREFKVKVNADDTYSLDAASGQALEVDENNKEGILPLERFCSLKRIKCKRNAGERHYKTIYISGYNLEFNVSLIDGQPRAFSDKFPEFFIAPQQDVPELRRYGSYLLLSNNKSRKVFIPAGHGVCAGMWHLYKYLQPFTHLLPVGTEFNGANEKFYVFDMDDKGELISDDAEAVAYLLQMNLIQMNQRGIEFTMDLLTALAKKAPINQELWNKLLPLTLAPPMVSSLQIIRIRLFAAMEENRLLHPAKVDKKAQPAAPNMLASILYIQAIIGDLYFLQGMSQLDKKLAGQGALSGDKEWYLYGLLFRQFKLLLQLQDNLPERLVKYIRVEERLEAIIQLTVLPEALAHRYTELKEHYGIRESRFLHVLRGVKKAHRFSQVPDRYNLDPYKLAGDMCRRYFPEYMDQLDHIAKEVGSYLEVEGELCRELVKAPRLYRWSRGVASGVLIKFKEAFVKTLPLPEPAHFDVKTIDAARFRSLFPYYYAVARGERSYGEGKMLKKLLIRLGQSFDTETNQLIELLNGMSSMPFLYPSSTKLLTALRTVPNFPAVSESALKKLDDLQYVVENEPTITIDSIYRKYLRLYDAAVRNPEKFLKDYKSQLEALLDVEKDEVGHLAAYLLLIAITPKENLPVGKLETRLVLLKEERKFRVRDEDIHVEWIKLWRSIESAHLQTSVGTSIFNVATTGAPRQILAKGAAFVASTWVGTGIPYMIFGMGKQLSKGVNMALHAKNSVERALTHTETAPKQVAGPSLPYQRLAVEDIVVDGVLKSFFDEVFVAVKLEESTDVPFAPLLRVAKMNKMERNRLDRVNENIRDFYAQPAKQYTYQIKDLNNLWGIYKTLSTRIAQMEATITNDEEQLLALVNTKKHRTGNPINFQQLVLFVLTGDMKLIGDHLLLDAAMVQKLDFLIVRQLARGSRLMQMQRVRRLIEEVSTIDPETERLRYFGQIEAIADELRATRAYKFDRMRSPRLILRLLCFEYYSDKLVWPKQLECISKPLLGPKGNQVIELIMSLGKTAFGTPVINDFLADGTQLPVNIRPDGIAGTNEAQFLLQVRRLFQRGTSVLRFDRNHSMALQELQAIKVSLQAALENMESFNSVRVALQALKLSLVEMLYMDRRQSASSGFDTEGVMLELKDILFFLFTKAHAVGDEAHELFCHSHELNYPVGKSKVIALKYYKIMEKCILQLMREPTIVEAIANNNKVVITQEIKERIAARFKKDPEFIAFVTGKSDKVPESVRKDKRFDEIALVKGMLTVLIPNTFSKESFVDHGPSAAGNGEFSRPYEANTRPMENSLLRSPYEALTKTFFQFFHTGLDDERVNKALMKLRDMVKKESEKGGIDKSKSFVLFRKLCPNADLNNSKTWPIKALQKNHVFICFYIQNFVYDLIKYWDENICSNSQHIGSIFAKQTHMTGTPFNDGTYPNDVDVLWDKGTIGQALHIASNKCKGVKVLKKQKPTEILQEVLQTYFGKGSDFTALIDGSAVLKGIEDVDVAKAMVDFVKVHRPDIRGIVFFMRDKNDRDQLYCWEVTSPAAVPFERTNIPPAQRITYFDQLHGFAADVPQKANAKAVNLVGDRVTLFRLVQEIFRMRGIKNWTKLTGDDLQDLKDQTQTIHFAMTADTAAKIGARRSPTFRDIVRFAVMNEAKVSEENYYAYRNKIAAVSYGFVIERILKASSVREMRAIYAEHEEILVTKNQMRPDQIWGFVTKKEKTTTVLQELELRELDRFEGRDEEEIRMRLDELKPPVMPDFVDICTDGRSKRYDADSDIGQIVTVTATQNQNQTEDLNQEQEMEQDQNLHNNVHDASNLVPFYEEQTWNDKFDPLVPKSKEPSGVKIWDMGLISSSTIRKIGSAFDKRIWFSNNFIPSENPRVSSMRRAELGSKVQRPLIHLLVTAEKTADGLNILSVGCLSIKDAAYWRKRLAKSPEQSDKVVFVYDVPNATIIGGAKDLGLEKVRKNQEFFRILVQLKFLSGEMKIYSDRERVYLKEWFESGKVHDFREAAMFISQERNPNESMRNSTLDMILCDLEEEEEAIF